MSDNVVPLRRFTNAGLQHEAPENPVGPTTVIHAFASTVAKLAELDAPVEFCLPAPGTDNPSAPDRMARLLGEALAADPDIDEIILVLAAQHASAVADLLSLLARHLRGAQRAHVLALTAVACHIADDDRAATAALAAADDTELGYPALPRTMKLAMLISSTEPRELRGLLTKAAKQVATDLQKASDQH